MHTHVTCWQARPSCGDTTWALRHHRQRASGSPSCPPVMALEDLSPLCPSPTQGIWSRWEVDPTTRITSHLCAFPPSSQPGHQLPEPSNPSGRGRGRGRPELPAPQDAQCQGLYLTLPEGAWRERSQPGWEASPLGPLEYWLCEDSQSSPGRSQAPELEWEGGLGPPADLASTMTGLELRLAGLKRQGQDGGLGPSAHSCWGQLGPPSGAQALLPTGWKIC